MAYLKIRGRNALAAGLAVFMTVLVALTSSGPAFAQQGQGIVLLRDAETEAWLRKLTTPIFTAAGIDPQAVHIYIVGDMSINAFVAGGQNLFVNTGLIVAADNPNELVGVFAHETGHMAAGHLTRSPGASVSLPYIIGMVAGIGAMAAGSPDAGTAILAGSGTIAQRNMAAFTRVQEASADQAAARFLLASHQSGKGLLTLFQKLANDEAMSYYQIDPYIQDHPISSERIDALQNEVEKSPYYNDEDSQAAIDKLDLIKAKIYGFLERTDAGLRRFPPSDTSAPARYARSVIYFRLGNMTSALAEINSLIKEQPKNAYFEELKGQELYESGHVAESVEPYERSVAIEGNEPLLRFGYGQSLSAAAEKTHDKAMMEKAGIELRAALAVEPDMPDAWRALGQVYSLQGKEGLAELATAEMYYNTGNMAPAVEFAVRARRKLDKGSVPYNRATDILEVAKASGADLRQRRPE